jgi:hypothetical protein
MHMTRIRALAVVGLLAVSAIVLVVLTISRDTQNHQVQAETCKPGQVPVSLTMPNEPEVNIKVFNATQTQGLGASVAADFKNRNFNVAKIDGEKDAAGKDIYYPDEVAILRYGPKTVGAAHLVRAYFLNDATMKFDIKREDDVVDVVIGGNFKQLATPTEMRQAVAILGHPKLPAGTCSANS